MLMSEQRLIFPAPTVSVISQGVAVGQAAAVKPPAPGSVPA